MSLLPFLCGAVLGCTDLTDTLPAPRPELTVTQAGTWCRLVRFTITSDTTVTPDYPDDGCAGSSPGLLARKLIGQPMHWNGATRLLTVPVRIENRTSYSITLPIKVELGSGEGNKKVIIPSGTSNTKIIPINADSTRGDGTKVWLVGGTGLLDASDTSVVHSLTFQVDTPVVKGELWFVLKGEEVIASMPAVAPDSEPAWTFDDSTFVNGTGAAKRVLGVQFHGSATVAQRDSARSLVGAVLVGGYRPTTGGEGYYTFYLPGDTTIARLRTAAALLKQLSFVREAAVLSRPVPQMRRPSDGSGWGSADWNVGLTRTLRPSWALEDLDAPLAWGCETGDPAVKIAVVDYNFRSYDLDGNIDGSVPQQVPPSIARRDHGYKVSSALAARGDNATGMVGMMWRAKVQLRQPQLSIYASQKTAEAVVMAARAGASIINISLGAPVDSA